MSSKTFSNNKLRRSSGSFVPKDYKRFMIFDVNNVDGNYVKKSGYLYKSFTFFSLASRELFLDEEQNLPRV